MTGGSDTVGNAAQHAFLYSGGIMIDLGTLGGTNSAGRAINSAGDVVGGSDTVGDATSHAFLQTDGTMTDLNTLIDPALNITLSSADGINDAGQIVANGNGHAYLLSPVVVPESGTLVLLPTALAGLFLLRGRIGAR